MNDVSSMGLKCAGCGVAVTELPFVPDGSRPVYCRDCNSQRRTSFRDNRGGGNGGMGGSRPARQLQDVSAMGIKCAGCGTPITQLPFTPDPSRAIYCKDCYKRN